VPDVRKSFLLRALLRAPVFLYRWRMGRFLGHRFLLLTHTGRRTGKRLQTMLEVLEFRTEIHEAVVMSGFGPKANWLQNIEATNSAEIDIASEHFRAAFRILDEDEAVRVLSGYEQRNRFILPIVRSVLSRLLGWKYTGTEDARHKLIRSLPLIAFRPRG